jgi:capsular polysaccharide biosynthesis protein
VTSEVTSSAGTVESLSIRRHGELLRGGLRVIIISIVIAVIGAVAVSLSLPRTWTSSATLYVGQSLTEPSFDYGGLLASQLLTPTYARLATSTDLLEAVAVELGLDERPEQLANRVEADAPAGGTLITLTGTADSPENAAALTNAVAEELLRRAPAERTDQAELQSALAEVDTEIATTRQTLLDLLAQPTLTGAQQETVNQLQERLDALQSTRGSLSDELASRSPNALTLVEPARAPISPSGPNRTIIVASSAAVAMAVAVLFVYASSALRRPRVEEPAIA